jgi:hypothetical protein
MGRNLGLSLGFCNCRGDAPPNIEEERIMGEFDKNQGGKEQFGEGGDKPGFDKQQQQGGTDKPQYDDEGGKSGFDKQQQQGGTDKQQYDEGGGKSGFDKQQQQQGGADKAQYGDEGGKPDA